MEVYIANAVWEDVEWRFEYVEYIEEYDSLIWTNRWRECGDFVLTVPTNELKSFTSYGDLIDKFLILKGSPNDYMIIESYSMTYNADQIPMITIKGRDLKSLLMRRIVWGQKIYQNKTIMQICDNLVLENIISPASVTGGDYRTIQGFQLGGYSASEIISDIQFTGDNLYDAIIQVCTPNNDLLYAPDVSVIYDQWFYFTLYAGQTREMLFAPDLDNLQMYEEFQSYEKYKNAWLIGGEGEGSDRRYKDYTWQGGSVKQWGIGLFRREKFVDARDISSNNGEVGTDAYNNMLLQRGLDNRLDTWIDYVSTANLLTSNYTFNKDYKVGDKITIVDNLGNSHTARITEFIRSFDVNGYKEYPNFEIN